MSVVVVGSDYIIHMKINVIKTNNHLIQSPKTTFRENSNISINILLIAQNNIIQLLNLVYINCIPNMFTYIITKIYLMKEEKRREKKNYIITQKFFP